jgi:hypothetical protein
MFLASSQVLGGLYPNNPKFHAWTGNKGVAFWMLTVLRAIFTPGLEIKESFGLF